MACLCNVVTSHLPAWPWPAAEWPAAALPPVELQRNGDVLNQVFGAVVIGARIQFPHTVTIGFDLVRAPGTYGGLVPVRDHLKIELAD
jgi:hypothetical protein